MEWLFRCVEVWRKCGVGEGYVEDDDGGDVTVFLDVIDYSFLCP